MALAGKFSEKTRLINDIYSKMAPDEKKMMLRLLVKNDMKLYFEAIWEEQKFLEEETGIDGAYLEEMTECGNTSEKAHENSEIESGLEVNLAGKVSKEAENAYYLDEKCAKKQGNDRFDGFLGYVSDSKNAESSENEIGIFDVNGLENEVKNEEKEPETVLEPDENMIKIEKNEGKIEEV